MGCGTRLFISIFLTVGQIFILGQDGLNNLCICISVPTEKRRIFLTGLSFAQVSNFFIIKQTTKATILPEVDCDI